MNDNKCLVTKRKNELIRKHPDILELLMKDVYIKNWFEQWSRSDDSIEDGFMELIKILYASRKELSDRYIDYVAKSNGITPNVSGIKPQ